MELPSGFIEMMRRILGDDAGAFFLAMGKAPVVSVRLNGRKASDAFNTCRGVKWCPQGRYLDSRPVFTLDPLLHAGAYYVQDASSMILYETVKRILASLAGNDEASAGTPLSVLDLCAAPGGKTTAMVDALPDGSRVVANEYVAKRAAVLKENITKWGYPLVSVTNRAPSWFADNGDRFDIVAVDAPCSGEGMMRKDPDAVAQWSPGLISQCAALQREILKNAVKALKPGGFLLYSTCTFNTEENERNAEFINDELGLSPFEPGFPQEWGIPRGIGTTLPVYRFMPHKTEGEGLFLAVFRKPGKFEPGNLPRGLATFPAVKIRVTEVPKKGERKGKGAKPVPGKKESQGLPDMEEILSVASDLSRFPAAELTKEQAVAYLRRESVALPPDVPKGIVIVTYQGLPLGPVKNIGVRANNLYPKAWRILMR